MSWRFDEADVLADLKLIVEADSFESVLIDVGKAFFEISTNCKPDSAKVFLKKEINIEGKTKKDLIISFLDELIFLKDTESLVFPKLDCQKAKNGYKIILKGGKVEEYGQGLDVKALSYHKLEVKKTNQGWKVVLVFDV